MNEKAIKRAEEILKAAPVREQGCCVLAQVDGDGYPSAATISPSKIEGIKRIFFCCGFESNWVKRAEKNSRAAVCFNSPAYNITLIGDVSLITGPSVKNEMWYEGMGRYYSGPEDPNFCLLEFQTRRYSLMLAESDASLCGRGIL